MMQHEGTVESSRIRKLLYGLCNLLCRSETTQLRGDEISYQSFLDLFGYVFRSAGKWQALPCDRELLPAAAKNACQQPLTASSFVTVQRTDCGRGDA